MKPVIAFIAAFVVATAASTGASVAMHKGSRHLADSLAVADSVAKASAAGDSAKGPAPDSGTVYHDSSAPAQPPAPAGARGSAAPVPAGASTAIRALPGAPSPDSMASAGKRLAQVFAAMTPAEAEKNLEHFSDADAQIILSYIGAKQAAPILALMPPERVAALGKAALHGKGR